MELLLWIDQNRVIIRFLLLSMFYRNTYLFIYCYIKFKYVLKVLVNVERNINHPTRQGLSVTRRFTSYHPKDVPLWAHMILSRRCSTSCNVHYVRQFSDVCSLRMWKNRTSEHILNAISAIFGNSQCQKPRKSHLKWNGFVKEAWFS